MSRQTRLGPRPVTDPFGTAELRGRVLDAWTASPARFREDANAEEDLALGAYRDRLVVELAQNAADAASRAGVPGRLRFALRDRTLVAANTGAPLDAAGVEALSTLRASAKRDAAEAVGRFGVGFAAVLAVTDEPRMCSTTGAVRWSRAQTQALVRETPSLVGELTRRGGTVPVLRLPFPATCAPPDGFDTAVELPLRDEAAERLVRGLLDDVDPALMVALPALTAVEVEVDGVVLELRADHAGDELTVDVGGAPTRWKLARAVGRLAPELLADRPTEERARPVWSLTWAIPVDTGGLPRSLPSGVPAVVHAPTPSDERLGLPALLLASFPLAPDRRHVAPGPLTDFLVERAAVTYAEALRDLPSDPTVLSLVPGPVGVGELDARLRRAVLAVLPETPFLPAAGDEDAEVLLRPRDAVAVEGTPALVDVLAPVLPGLLPAGWAARTAALTALGVRRLGIADVVDLLAELRREPDWWPEVYAALEGAGAGELGALPVPLVDGRLVRGPRGLLLAGRGVDAEALAPLSLRVVHPAAAHPLLRRLGAVEASPRAVLDDPATRAAVAASYDEEDPELVAGAVLTLVAAADLAPGEEPWLADLALPGDDGEVYPAGELLLPDGRLAAVMAEDAPFGVASPELVGRFGAAVLRAVGVLDSFAVLREDDVPLDPSGMDHDLDGEEEWAADALAGLPETDVPPLLPELVAVRDLELVADWDEALALLAEPPLRAAVVPPAFVLLPDGGRAEVPSYTSWWLRRHPVLRGRRPDELRAPGGDLALAGLYDDAPPGTDAELLAALGVRTSLARLLAEPGGPDELLARLADPARPVPRTRLRSLLAALAHVDPERVAPPERLRALVDGETTVVPADRTVVLDAPDLLPLLRGRPLLLVPYGLAERLADVLDVALASEVVAGAVEGAGRERQVPEVVRQVLPGAPETYVAHDPLLVDGRQVAWRCVDGVVHAAGAAGLARGLAWVAGRWETRLLVAAVLAAPEAAADLLAEADLDASTSRYFGR